MKLLTVEDLYKELWEAINNGCGKKTIYVMTDEEGNDYRPIYFGVTTNRNEVEKILNCTCSGLSLCEDIDNAVIIG